MTESTVDQLLSALRTGDWLDRQTFPPLHYAVPGIIPEGTTMLVAPPKAGKSWLCLGVALGVAAGGHVLGRLPVDSRPVLYLALEDGDRRLQDRCRVLLHDASIPAGFEYLTRLVPGRVEETIAAWLDRKRHDPPPLVILDTLGRTMPATIIGESAYQRDYRTVSVLKEIIDSRPGASLVIVHHTRKGLADDFVDSISGTQGLGGAADTILVLSRPRQDSEAILKVTGRDVTEAEYALTTHGGVWKLAGPGLVAARAEAARRRVTADLGDQSVEIVGFVAEHPNGVRAKDVQAKFGDDARRYLSRLADAGRITRIARGLYVPTVPTVPTGGEELKPLGQRDSGDSGCTACGRLADRYDESGYCPGCREAMYALEFEWEETA